jgi:hypothetical protein
MRCAALLGVLSALPLGTIGIARADVVELTNGGQIEGKVIEGAPAASTLVVETSAGSRVTLARSAVANIVKTSTIQAEYDQRAQSTPDTAEAQWELAEWCREHSLSDQAKQHLTRVVELDPDHAEARQLLGQRETDGAWKTRDEMMATRGLVKYEGKWRTPQHVELMEREKEIRTATAEWSNRLNRLRRWIVGRREERAVQARDEVLAIRDPLAAEPLIAMLGREEDHDLKRLWIAVVAQMDHSAAVNTLVELSLFDPDESIRAECLEYLIKADPPGLATPYIRALRNRDNEIINRAAAALGQIGDRGAMAPLIEVLVTKHKFQVGASNADQHSYSFSPNGGGGGAGGGGSYNFGGAAPKIVTQSVKNPEVLSALVALSDGTSFDYNQPQWRSWLAAQAKLDSVDVRRDQ